MAALVSGVEDLGFLGFEFGVGQDALGVQLGELLQLGNGVGSGGRGWLRGGGLLLLFVVGLIVLRSPTIGLPAGDAVRTAVAVPATTAVRATPLRSPGMRCPFVVSLVGGVEGGENGVLRNVSCRHQLGPSSTQGFRKGCRPSVLEDQDAG